MGSSRGVTLCQGSRQRSWTRAVPPSKARTVLADWQRHHQAQTAWKASSSSKAVSLHGRGEAGRLAREEARIPDVVSTHKPHPLLLQLQPRGLALLCLLLFCGLPRWTGERDALSGWQPSSLALLRSSQQLRRCLPCAPAEEFLWSRADFWRPISLEHSCHSPRR